jgi:hypothetical protein
MDGKMSILVFLGLILVFTCLALGNLVEAPDLPQAASVPPPALSAEWVQPTVYQPGQSPAISRSEPRQADTAADTPLEPEQDRNGIPLPGECYRRAAYQKFPPEGFHG